MNPLNEFLRLSSGIEAALEYSGGTHTLRDVLEALTKDLLQFWPGSNSFLITELEQYPRKKNCHIFLAGGNLTELEQMLPKVEEWAKDQGCSALTLTGRFGWLRTFLRGAGYEPQWQVMAKELTNG